MVEIEETYILPKDDIWASEDDLRQATFILSNDADEEAKTTASNEVVKDEIEEVMNVVVEKVGTTASKEVGREVIVEAETNASKEVDRGG